MTPQPSKRRAYDYAERHLLPAGAQLLKKEPAEVAERTSDGRIELFIDRLIPGGGSLEVRYTYRLQTKP